jgi:hypothetical protein
MQTRTNPDTFADPKIILATTVVNLRAQAAPTAVGNTVFAGSQSYSIAILLGSAAAFDGTAAVYAWDASSALADNGTTVIKPDLPQAGGNPGRWRRLGSNL